MNIYPPWSLIAERFEVASRPMMGGMGVVYFCLDHGNHDRPVALKTFKPEYLPDRAARDRFLREGTAWVDLGRHPHIVRCYSVEYIDPTAFLVLELIAKEQDREDASLRSWLGQPMPVDQALLFALQIARGLRYAAEKIPGFVHRDLKPENVLVGADRLPGTNVNRLRVTDFGLAAVLKDEGGRMKDEDGPETIGRTHLTRGILGTPLYMAPEQWKEETVGVYTDIYALGCILLEMLSGNRPVNGYSLSDLQAAHCNGKLQPIPQNLPASVRSLLGYCLALKPGERYQAWQEVTAALEGTYHAISGQIVTKDAAVTEPGREERLEMGSSYNAMGLSYLDLGKAEIAGKYFMQVLALAQENKNHFLEASALGNLGTACISLGNVRKAIEYYERYLKLAQMVGDRWRQENAIGNLGNAYMNLGETQKALGYYEQALNISRELGDRQGMSYALGNLGNAFLTLGDARKALKYHEQALQFDREIADRRGEGNDLGNLGLAYVALGDFQRAFGCYDQQLAIVREIGDRQGEGNALGNLAIAYKELGDARRAIEYFEQSQVISHEIGNSIGSASAYLNMAQIHYQEGESNRALQYAREAERIFTQIDHSSYAKQARDVVEWLQKKIATQDPEEDAFDAFQKVTSYLAMQDTVREHPALENARFIEEIEAFIKEQVHPNDKRAFTQRLTWLKQIVGK
jgi:tetratricopeptide (TPR) repeat protein